jgi:hypothetical protein
VAELAEDANFDTGIFQNLFSTNPIKKNIETFQI